MNRFALILICCATVSVPGPVFSQNSIDGFLPDRVIHHQEINREGVSRLSDLFAVLTEWNTYSVEGFSWDVSVNGLELAQKNAWTVLIDGQPVDPGSLVSKSINAIPLSVVQIDSIQVYHTPVFIRGVFAPAGLLAIWTKKPDRTLLFEGSLAAGNETGDPGPYSYTANASPNIDRIGPSTDHFVSLAGKQWLFQYGLKTDEHHATDAQTIQRVYALYDDVTRPRLLLSSPNVIIRAGGASGWHTLYGGYTHFRDLTYVEPAGREVPNLYRYGHFGVNGDVQISTSFAFRYALTFESGLMSYRPNRIGLSLDGQQDRLRGNVEYGIQTGSFRAGFGANLRYSRLRTTQDLSVDYVTITEPYLSLQAGGTGFQQHLSALATTAEGKTGFKGLFSTLIAPASGQKIELKAAWIRKLPAEENDLWYWMARGYRLPGSIVTGVIQPAYLVTSDAGTVDLKWTLNPGRSISIALSGSYRKFLRQRASLVDVYDLVEQTSWPLYEYFAVQTRGVIGLSGQIVGAAAEIDTRVNSHFNQHLKYAYLRPRADQDAFFTLWQIQPWHRLDYAARWQPVERFSLKLDARYTAPTRWLTYDGVSDVTGGRFPDRLPANILVNLSASKQFWNDHLRAGFMVWNLLNREIRYHPAGAITRMTFYVHLNYRFGGGDTL